MSLFCNKTFREISTRTWSIYLVDGKPIKHVFVFTPSMRVIFFVNLDGRHVFAYSQCRSKTFLGGSKWKAYFCAYPQCRNSAYVDGVYVILILKA